MTSPSTPVWATPIPQRAPISWRTLLLGILWSVAFNGGIFLTYGLQLVLYPLSLFSSTIPPYKRVTKGVFGQLCVFMTEWWAPTSFVISSDGMGDKFVKRDGQGRVNGLDLPKRSVWVSLASVCMVQRAGRLFAGSVVGVSRRRWCSEMVKKESRA